jgi:PAS domain S-box-containing protein
MVSRFDAAPEQDGDAATRRWWHSRRRVAPVVAALSLGAILSVAGWFVTARFWEDSLVASELGMVGENRVLAVDTTFESQIKLVDDLRGYFGSLGGIPRHDEFEAVKAHLAGEEQHPVSVTWVAHVRDQDRASFESQIRVDQPGFEIRDRRPDGTIVTAARRPEYYAVLFAGGLNGSTPGIDLGTDGVLLDTIHQASTLARTTATPVRPDGPNGSWVISIVAPLFQRGPAANGLSGFILGTFDLGAVIASVPHSVVAFHGVDTYLFNEANGADAAPLYIRSSVLHTKPAPIRSRGSLEGGPHWAGKVTAADYRLALIVVPVSGGPLDPWHVRAWIVLLVLLLCTAAISAAFAQSARTAYALEVSLNDLRGRDAVLQAVAASGAVLVGTLDFQQATATTLALVGRATGVDRVHLVRRTLPADAATRWDQQLWSAAQEATPNPAPGIDGNQLGDDVLQPILGRQMQGGAIVVNAEQETGTLRTALDRSKIQSILVVPALLTQNSQCLLVFVHGATDRHWSGAENALLKVVADLLGGALARYIALAQLADADQIIENSPTMLFRATAEPGWPLTYVSDNVARYGYSAAELCATRQKVDELIHPDDLPGVRADLARAIHAGQPAIDLVCRERAADRSYQWFEIKVTIQRDSADRVVSISGIMLDVTERKRVEDALAVSHRLLNAFLEHSPDAIMFTDEHDQAIVTNQGFTELWRMPKELLGTGRDDNAITVAATLLKAPEGFLDRILYIHAHRDESILDELEFKDGRFFERRTVPLTDPAGRYLGRTWLFRDITKRKRAEGALAFSHSLLTASLENSPDGVLIADEHDNSIINNRRFSEQLSIPQELLAVGLDDKAIAGVAKLLEAPEEFVASVHYINSHREERTQDELKFKDGRTFERRSAPLSDKAGRYLGRTWLFRDVTERKQAQDALGFSNVLLTAALENSPDGILITDEHDRAIVSNARFVDLWSLPQSVSAAGLDDRTIAFRATLLKDPEGYLSRVRYIFAHHDERGEDELEFKDGRFFERHTAPLFDRERRYLGRIFVLRDITERRHAQDALAFSNVLLTAALDQSPDGIVVTDEHSRSIVSNPLFVSLWNLPAAMIKTGLDEDGIEARAAQLKDPHGFAARVRYIYAHRDERTREELEFKDGRFFERTTAPLSDSQGRHLGRIWVWHEITERKLAEQALAFSNSLLTAAMQSSPEGLLVVDAQGLVMAVNDRLLEIIRLPPEIRPVGDHEPLLAHFASLLNDSERFLDRVRHLYAHPEEQADDRIVAKDGRILDRHTASLYDGRHQYLGRIWFFRDITRRKLAEKALVFSNTLLTAAMNSSPYGMLVVDAQSRVISFNDCFVEMTKIPLKTLSAGLNEPVLAHFTALVKDPEQFLQRVRHIYEHPDEPAYDQFELKDGRILDRHSAALYTDQRHYLGRIWFFRDLSEATHAEPGRLTADVKADGLADRLTKSQIAEEARKAIRKARKPKAAEDPSDTEEIED